MIAALRLAPTAPTRNHANLWLGPLRVSCADSLMKRHVIVGLGGTTRVNSSTEKALKVALEAAERLGAETVLLGASNLNLPLYAPESPHRCEHALDLVAQLRRADGVIIASPGYHGGISGLLKNALDYTEDMRTDERPYLEGRAVGCIVTAAGWQATATTLVALRSVVHALRGWPTPFGATINTMEPVFDANGGCLSSLLADQIGTVAEQVLQFAEAFNPT
jgi:FMN reductase